MARTHQAYPQEYRQQMVELLCGVLPEEPVVRVRELEIAVRAVQLPFDRSQVGAERDHLIARAERQDDVAARTDAHRVEVRPVGNVAVRVRHALGRVSNVPCLRGGH